MVELPQGRVKGDTLVSRGGLSYSAFRSLFVNGDDFGVFLQHFHKKIPVSSPYMEAVGRVFEEGGFLRSLPYASPPVGDLRWAHPRSPPVPGWEGTRNGR